MARSTERDTGALVRSGITKSVFRRPTQTECLGDAPLGQIVGTEGSEQNGRNVVGQEDVGQPLVGNVESLFQGGHNGGEKRVDRIDQGSRDPRDQSEPHDRSDGEQASLCPLLLVLL